MNKLDKNKIQLVMIRTQEEYHLVLLMITFHQDSMTFQRLISKKVSSKGKLYSIGRVMLLRSRSKKVKESRQTKKKTV